MKKQQEIPSRRAVLDQMGMTEEEVQYLLEQGLTASEKELAEEFPDITDDVVAVSSAMKTPEEIIAQANELLNYHGPQ